MYDSYFLSSFLIFDLISYVFSGWLVLFLSLVVGITDTNYFSGQHSQTDADTTCRHFANDFQLLLL